MSLMDRIYSFGHPLSCSIWKDAVCDCPPEPRPLPSYFCQGCGSFSDSFGGKCEPGCGERAVANNIDMAFTEDDDVVASDTERPPVEKPKTCYWCGSRWELDVYHGIPSCVDCKRRAVGRRSK